MAEDWILDHLGLPGDDALLELDALPARGRRGLDAEKVPRLAVRLSSVVVHNTKKWSGEADIRIDALVVHGNAAAGDPGSVYMPGTFRFGQVKDSDTLPIGAPGMLLFHGRPLYFLDLFLTVSRDTKDSDDLSGLLAKSLPSPAVQGALSSLLALATPAAAAVAPAMGAAAVLGDVAYQVVRKVAGNTLGIYRTSYLQYPDGFGVGRHPEAGLYDAKAVPFAYEVVIAERPGP